MHICAQLIPIVRLRNPFSHTERPLLSCTLVWAVLVLDDEGNRPDAGQTEPSVDAVLLALWTILEGLPDAVVAATREGGIVFVNERAEQLFGYARDELIGRPVATLWPERVREQYLRNMQLYFATIHPLRFSNEAWGLRRDGSEFVGEMSWGIVQTNAGPLLLAVGRDISERRAAEDRLRALRAMGERALAGADPQDLADEAVVLLCETLPVSGAEVRLAGDRALASSGSTSRRDMRLSIGSDDELVLDTERDLNDEESGFVRAVAHILSTALARLRGEEQMRHEAVHDPLTGLANRTLFGDHLQQALARAERAGGPIGLLFLDLDNFKHVNDAHGHATGDEVLRELGSRLQAAVRPSDTVARLGGDEFVVLCEQVDRASAIALGERLQEAIRLPVTVGGAVHELSASIGIALGETDPDLLLSNADAALYRAKGRGGGQLEVFS
jgi:diguanylate cyclase (GGDEF)-like protein/PAS domain S-box-containing protein